MFRGKNAIKGVAFVDHKLTEAEQNKLISTYLFPKLESLIVMGYYDKIIEEKNEIDLSPKSQNHAVTLEKQLSRICLSFLNHGFGIDLVWEK